MKKALIITRVSGFLPQFAMNDIKILQSMGYEIHYASDFDNIVYGKDNRRLEGTGIICHPVRMTRNPLSASNIKAVLQLIALMKKEGFDLVHCHMPVGSVLGRIAAYVSGTAPVIYTAHGFHFYDGAPLKNWIPYYLIERFLAHATDVLITINREDYKRAKTFSYRKWKKKNVYYVPGIGIESHQKEEKTEKGCKIRNELGISPEHFLLVSVGELSERKNHVLLLETMSYLKGLPVSCVICGSGIKEIFLKQRIKELGLEKQVFLPGYMENVREFLTEADCFVFPSRQEGLPVAVMEAMAAGLPVIATDIRGNRDLIRHGQGGRLFKLDKNISAVSQNFAAQIRELSEHPELCKEYGKYNQKRIHSFRAEIVKEKMREIYESCEKI